MATPTVYNDIESGYSSNLVNVRQLESYLDIMDPDDYPLLQEVGLNSYDVEITNTKFEWQVDYLLPTQDTLGAAITTTDEERLTVAHAEYFVLHDVIMVETELFRVTSIDATNNYLYVERGFAGSTAATHDNSLTVYRLGPARPEGSSPGWARQTAAVQPYNYTQIWDAMAEVTGTEEALKNYGPDDLLAMRIDREMRNLYVVMEQALLYGLRYQPASNTGRTTGGLAQFIHDTDDLSSAPLTYYDLETAMANAADRVGKNNVPDSMYANSWVMRKVSSWGTPSIRTERTETVFGNVITTILTNFGPLRLVYDRLVATDRAYLLAMDRIMCGPLTGRGFKSYMHDIADTLDDARKERIIGEYGFVVKGEDGSNDGCHVMLDSISTAT